MPRVGEFIWINGYPKEIDEYDQRLLKEIDENRVVGIIVEVKGGFTRNSINVAIFSDREKLRKAFQRLGMYEKDIEKKNDYNDYKIPINTGEYNYQVLKILFSNQVWDFQINSGFLIIPLKHAEEFIRRRLEKYKEEKNGSWNLFPSDLIQYIIWQLNQDSYSSNV